MSIPVDRIPEVMFWQHAYIFDRKTYFGFFKNMACFFTGTQWKNKFETVERKKLKI